MTSSSSFPFRLNPPELPPGLVRRSRLLDELRLRFERRLTVVVGGAGFGKTTLLAHAVAENRLDPFGQDLWLQLTDRDRRPEHLLAGLVEAFGADPDEGVATDHLVELAWARAPEQLALVLDDGHVIDGSPAWAVIADLCQQLPVNVHLVIGSRTTPPLPLRLMQSRGSAVAIDETLLAFTPDELHQFAETNGLQFDEGDALPAWPALAVLMSSAGHQASVDYLWESIVQALPDERRRALAALVRFERIDDELVAAVVGDAWSAQRLVVGLPLIESSGGDHRFHDLWQAAFADVLAPAEWKPALAAGAEALIVRGELVRAALCLRTAGATTRLVQVARRFASSSISAGLSRIDAEVLLEVLPEHERRGALGRYLTALMSGAFETHHLHHDMADVYRSAIASGDDEMAALALWRSTQQQSDDDPSKLVVTDELTRLAREGWAVARSAVALIASQQAAQRRDVKAALEALAGFDALDPRALRSSVSTRLLALGHPERVAVTLDEVLSDSVADPVSAQAVWFRGDIDPTVAWPFAAGLPPLHGRRRLPDVQVPLLSIVASVALAAGEVAEARRLANSALAAALRLRPRIALFARVADALVVLAEEGDDAAIARFRQMVDEIPLEPWPPWAYLGALTPIRAFLGGTEWLDDLEVGPSMAVAIAAGRAIVDLRRRANNDTACRLPWQQPDLLRVHVPAALLCELAVSVSHEVPAAMACLQQVPDSTRWMHRLIDHPHGPTRSHANSMASTAPARPLHDVAVVTFGEFIVRRSDDVPISDRVRGGRVQQLLAQLVLDDAPTRVALAAKLWPALTPKQAGTNLRVTLASLLDLIEPDRRSGVSWFVRSVDGRLRLVDEGVSIDVRRFDHHIQSARDAERSGMPSLALDHYRNAFAEYAGEFLPGIDDADVENERLRLQTLAYNAGCRLGELLLAKGEPESALRDVVAAARIDPVSERAWRIQIRCHLALGSTSAARSTARRLRSILTDEHLTPDRETELLLARIDPPSP